MTLSVRDAVTLLRRCDFALIPFPFIFQVFGQESALSGQQGRWKVCLSTGSNFPKVADKGHHVIEFQAPQVGHTLSHHYRVGEYRTREREMCVCVREWVCVCVSG